MTSLADFRPCIHPDDVDRATDVNERAADLLARGDDYSIIFRIMRPDGEIRWLRSLAAVEHRDGVPTRAVGYVADITDSMRAELALREANRELLQEKVSLALEVLKDPLTGIANRRHLDAELPRSTRTAVRTGRACASRWRISTTSSSTTTCTAIPPAMPRCAALPPPCATRRGTPTWWRATAARNSRRSFPTPPIRRR